MPPRFSFGNIDSRVDTQPPAFYGTPTPDVPFRVALLGDFSHGGAQEAHASRPPLSERHPVLIDRDNFDHVLAQWGIELELPIHSTTAQYARLRIAALDDFHPDRIFAQVEAFRRLDDLRTRLSDPATCAAATAELQALTHTDTTPAAGPIAQQPAAAPAPAHLPPDQLLEHILEASPGHLPAGKPVDVLTDWQGYLRRLVAPHLVPHAPPHQRAVVAQMEAAMREQMRAIVHAPAFQALEAAWRAVFFLVHRLETQSQLQVYVLNVSKAELAADLLSSDDLCATALYRLLVPASIGSPGGQPWAVVAGNYTFDHRRTDVEVLGRMAKIAAHAGAPLLAAASPQVVGCASLDATPDPDDWSPPRDGEAWQALRQRAEAAYVALALPRFLLRLPYGRETDPIQAFAFEELDERPVHDHYLWGNPAFACVYLLAEAFSHHGWHLRPGVVREIDSLPVHIYHKDGEARMQPCTEALLTERAVERLLEHGLIPLLAFRGRDVSRLARFHSIASPLQPLAGRWRG
jgi:type VI secretion system protein ImpC